MSLESSPLLNSPVSELEAGAVEELLAVERCTTEADKKEYVTYTEILLAEFLSLSLSVCRRIH